MKSWLMHHLHVMQFTLRRLRTSPVSSMLNVLVIGVALSLPSGGYVLLQNVQSLSDKLVGTPQISVFLSMNVSQDDIARLTRQLQQHDAISHIEFVPREQALLQLQQSTGLADVTGGLTQNPLPHAFIVYPKNKDLQLMEVLRDELRSCLKRLDAVNQDIKQLEAQRPQLDRERDELKAAAEVLKNERAELDRQLIPVREWENKVRAHSADIEAFNTRNDGLAQAPRNQQDKLIQELKVERERLEKVREGLAADEARLIPAYKASAAAHNERVTARDAKVTDWNARNAAAVDASAKQQDARALWLNECANRPYLEDDEKAIKAGK